MTIVPAAADADGARHLAEAERALHELDFPAAAAALDRALVGGNNGPRATARIHFLTGIVAASFGRGGDAQAAFAHALAIDPTLSLDRGHAPRIEMPFARARASLDDGESFLSISCRTAGTATATVAAVDIDADPTALVAGVAARYRDGDGQTHVDTARGSVDPTVDLTASPDGRIRVVAIDAHGNEVTSPCWADPPPRVDAAGGSATVAAARVASDAPVVVAAASLPHENRSRSLYRRWELWASGAGVAAAAAGWFGWRARVARADLDDIIANSSEHTYAEAQVAERRGERHATHAGVSLVVAGGAAATALALWLLDADADPRDDAGLTLHAGASGAGVGWVARF